MKETTKNLLIIGGVFLALIITVLIFGISSSVKKVPDDTIGNTAGNLNNGGLFCEYNGKVYFSNAYDGGTLYVMNSDETEVKKLNDSIVKYINASESYLVYYQEGVHTDDDLSSIVQNYGIFRTDLKGKNADWAVSVWCVCYGKNILHKPCDIEISQAKSGQKPAIVEEKNNGETYISLMQKNLEVLKEALG